MNNYNKILNHLKQFEGDGKYHPIEDLIDVNSETKRIIFGELSREGFINLKGGYRNIDMLISFGDGKGNIYTPNMPDKIVNFPYEGQITFKGANHLRNEMTMKSDVKVKTGKNSNVNLIIDSTNSKIVTNSKEIIRRSREIIKKIQSDKTVNTIEKQKAVELFQHLIEETSKGELSASTWDKALQIGSNISSIGSLILSLIPFK